MQLECEKQGDNPQNSWVDSERPNPHLQSNDEMHNPNAPSDNSSPIVFKKRKPSHNTNLVLGLTESRPRHSNQTAAREASADKSKSDVVSLKFKGILLSRKLLLHQEGSVQKEQFLAKQHSSSTKKKRAAKPSAGAVLSHNITLSPKNPHASLHRQLIEKCSTESHLPGMIGHLINSNKRSHKLTAKEAQFKQKMDKYSRNRSTSRKQAERSPAAKPATQLYDKVAPRYLDSKATVALFDRAARPELRLANGHLELSPPASNK